MREIQEVPDGTRQWCVVLDPFAGVGTTGKVAVKHGRRFIGVEINPKYAEMARREIAEAEALAREQRRQQTLKL